MKNNRMFSFLCAFLTTGILNIHAQEKIPDAVPTQIPTQTQIENPEQKPVAAIIKVGKRNENFIEKNAIIKSGKLSAFYFEVVTMDTANLRIAGYRVSIFRPNKRESDLDLQSYTDAFPARVFEILRASPAKTKVIFESVKISETNSQEKSMKLMPPLSLTLTEDE